MQLARTPEVPLGANGARTPTPRRRRRGTGFRRMLRSVALACLASALGIPAFASRTLTDELGRTVTVPDHPHRILCLAPGIVDTAFALGAGADVAAITDFAKYPSEALKKPSVGSPMNPSVEAIVSLHPDLAIGLQTGLPLEVNARIASLGIPVFLIGPHGLPGLLKSVASVGDALNRKPEAGQLVERLQARIQAVRRRSNNLHRVTVFMPISVDPLITIGRGAFITEMIDAAGGTSITEDLPAEWPQMSLESLIVRAPQALLLIRNGHITLDSLKRRPVWGTLPAVRQGRVFYVDDRIILASPVAIDALEDLEKELHP